MIITEFYYLDHKLSFKNHEMHFYISACMYEVIQMHMDSQKEQFYIRFVFHLVHWVTS
jgi:hypothetical protein